MVQYVGQKGFTNICGCTNAMYYSRRRWCSND